jgi:hypothetical protein
MWMTQAAATNSFLGLLDPGAEGRREDQLLAGRDAPRRRNARKQRPALPCGRPGAMQIKGGMSLTLDQREKKGTGGGARPKIRQQTQVILHLPTSELPRAAPPQRCFLSALPEYACLGASFLPLKRFGCVTCA